MAIDIALLPLGENGRNKREHHGYVRVGNRLDSVIPCIHEQFDIPSSQARDTL